MALRYEPKPTIIQAYRMIIAELTFALIVLAVLFVLVIELTI